MRRFEFALVLARRDQFVAGLLAEGLHVLERAGVGRGDGERLALARSVRAFLVRRMGSGQFMPRASRVWVAFVLMVKPPLVDDRSVKMIGKKNCRAKRRGIAGSDQEEGQSQMCR
jgi:hypothetical protein